MASSIQILRSTIARERPFPNSLLEGQPAANLNSQEPGLFFKASDGSLIKIGPAAITYDGLPPNSSPNGQSGNCVGELWLDASTSPAALKIFDGSQWEVVSNPAAVEQIIVNTGLSAIRVGNTVTLNNTGVVQLNAGSGVSLSGSTGTITVGNTGVTQLTAGSGVSLSAATGAITVANTGVTQLAGGTGISVSNSTGSISVSNTGVTQLIAGPNISLSGSTGAITISATGGGGGGNPAYFVRWIYTAVGGETSLSGVSGGIPLQYVPGLEEVFINGALITKNVDYTANDGTTVTGLVPLTAGDVVTVTSDVPPEIAYVPGASLLRWYKSATAGQTVLSGLDNSGQTLAYTPNFEEVFVNGVLLRRGLDYTATNGTSITLITALTASDEVTVLAFSAFTLGSVTTANIQDGAITDPKVSASANISSSKLSFLQGGFGGAQARTVQSKLRDIVSVKDFGALGDGVTNDAPAFTAALGSFQNVRVPKGNYRLNTNVTVPLNYTLVTDFGVTFTGPGSVVGPGYIENYGPTGVGQRHVYNLGERYITTTDSDALNYFETAIFRVATEGNRNAIVGAVVQTGPNAGFPCGVTGYGKLNHAGNQAFGVFARADGYTSGVITHEFNTFNYSAPPAQNFPPNRGFGTPDTVPVTMTVAAGGTHQSLIGVQVCREGGVPNSYVCGYYSTADSVTKYGVFIDSGAAQGPDEGLRVNSKMTGSTVAGIVVQSKNPTPSTSASFIRCLDSAGNQTFAVEPTGRISIGSGNNQSTVGAAGAASPLPANPTGYLRIVVAGSVKIIPYYEPT